MAILNVCINTILEIIDYKLHNLFSVYNFRLFSHGQRTQIMIALKLLSLAFLYNLVCHSKLSIKVRLCQEIKTSG